MHAQDGTPRAGEDYPVSWRQFLDRFGTEEACVAYLQGLRWPQGFVCPHCAARTAPYPCSRGRLVCRTCGFQATVTAGTVFDKTRTPLRVWLAACWYLVNQKHGASALGLQRALGLGSYQTAWAMLHRLRKAMAPPAPAPLQGVVEIGDFCLDAGRIALAVEVARPPGVGQVRLRRLAAPSMTAMASFILGNVAPGAALRSAHAEDCQALARLGYACEHAAPQGARQPAMPGMHRVAALVRRWEQHLPQGAVQPTLLDAHLREFSFRFNLRGADSVGLLFHRLLQQAMHTAPATYRDIVQCRPE